MIIIFTILTIYNFILFLVLLETKEGNNGLLVLGNIYALSVSLSYLIVVSN